MSTVKNKEIPDWVKKQNKKLGIEEAVGNDLVNAKNWSPRKEEMAQLAERRLDGREATGLSLTRLGGDIPVKPEDIGFKQTKTRKESDLYKARINAFKETGTVPDQPKAKAFRKTNQRMTDKAANEKIQAAYSVKKQKQ